MGRVVEPAKEVPKPSRKSDRDEDAIHRQMFVDQSAPQGAAPVLGRLPNEYFYNGQKHRLMPLNPEDIVGDKNVKFHHENLKFLSLLLRGHELEDHPLLYNKGCWTDVDKLLDHFNYCRDRRSGVRQLLRAAKADKKGRIRLQGIDIPTRETIGQPLFPVRIRVSQGLKKLVQDVDTDLFLATRFYSLLDDSQAERMSSVKGVAVLPFNQGSFIIARMREGWAGILQGGMVPGSAKSDRSHNYLSEVRLDDTRYKRGMRSNQPIEVTIDPIKAMEAGCEFFVTETEAALTRGTIPPSCVIRAVDASKKDLPLYVAKDEATREGEPGSSFRAKRDYEETASASSAPPPKQAATAPKAVASKKMPKSSPKPSAAPIAKLGWRRATRWGHTHTSARPSWPMGCSSASDAERHRLMSPPSSPSASSTMNVIDSQAHSRYRGNRRQQAD